MIKSSRIAVFSLLFSLSLVACKKESGSKSDNNPYNNTVETKPPVQKPISVNVNSNIGGYQEALPALYDSTTKRYPLLLFIHGVGELGNGVSDLWMAGNIGTPGLIKNGKFPSAFTSKNQSFSFIVISPQFKAWPSTTDMDAMVNYAINKYRIDTNRIYVSGLSMGGGATWEYAAAYSKKITAIAPICGAAGPNDSKAQKLAQAAVKIWAFHNQDDNVVTVNNSTGWVNKYNSYSPSTAGKITIWPTGGHDAWTKATDPNYREAGLNVYEWMLQHVK